MNCPNCGTQLTCGCQKKTASNGAIVCSNCLSAYEEYLKILQANPISFLQGVIKPEQNE